MNQDEVLNELFRYLSSNLRDGAMMPSAIAQAEMHLTDRLLYLWELGMIREIPKFNVHSIGSELKVDVLSDPEDWIIDC